MRLRFKTVHTVVRFSLVSDETIGELNWLKLIRIQTESTYTRGVHCNDKMFIKCTAQFIHASLELLLVHVPLGWEFYPEDRWIIGPWDCGAIELRHCEITRRVGPCHYCKTMRLWNYIRRTYKNMGHRIVELRACKKYGTVKSWDCENGWVWNHLSYYRQGCHVMKLQKCATTTWGNYGAVKLEICKIVRSQDRRSARLWNYEILDLRRSERWKAIKMRQWG